MLKIGFDAKRIFQNFTGLGNYGRTLIETLATFYPDNEFHLFAPTIEFNNRTNFIQQFNSIKAHEPTGFWKFNKNLWRAIQIPNELQKNDVSIFHGLSNELPIGIEKKSVKTIVSIHDLIFERYPDFYPKIDRKIYRWKFKSACERADLVVAISEQTKTDLIDFYQVDAQKIKVVYQSCDKSFYQKIAPENRAAVLEKYQLPTNFLLYVGTVNERKNLLTLVKAMRAVKLNLVVIGDGKNYFETIKNYIAEHKLSNQIYLRPKVNFADMPAIYQSALALVYPSFFEGFGIPIIESLNSGTPVITSKGSCFAEAGGEGAWYVSPNEVNELIDAIQQISINTALRNQLIEQGFKHVQKFKHEQIGSDWMKIYRQFN